MHVVLLVTLALLPALDAPPAEAPATAAATAQKDADTDPES